MCFLILGSWSRRSSLFWEAFFHLVPFSLKCKLIFIFHIHVNGLISIQVETAQDLHLVLCELSPVFSDCRYFIFTSFWAYKIYYVYGFMLLVFIILMIVTVCVTIVCTYFLLNAEDYRWSVHQRPLVANLVVIRNILYGSNFTVCLDLFLSSLCINDSYIVFE